MNVSSTNAWNPRPLADNQALTYNRQKQIAYQNAQSGSQIDLKKEVNATVAQSIVSVFC